MPKFTDERRSEIRRTLLDVGAEQFADRGLEETAIADLTGEAGIATGTFYSFFDSKEELLAAILRREAEHVYADLRVVLKENEDDPETALRQFVRVAGDALVTTPLFRKTISREDRARLVEELPDTDILESHREKRDILVPYIEQWQQAGRITDGDVDTIASGILYIATLALRRDEIGDARYPTVRDCLIDWMVAGLCT